MSKHYSNQYLKTIACYYYTCNSNLNYLLMQDRQLSATIQLSKQDKYEDSREFLVTPWISELSFFENFSDLFLDLRLDLLLITSLDLKLEHISFPCSSSPWIQAFPMPFH